MATGRPEIGTAAAAVVDVAAVAAFAVTEFVATIPKLGRSAVVAFAALVVLCGFEAVPPAVAAAEEPSRAAVRLAAAEAAASPGEGAALPVGAG